MISIEPTKKKFTINTHGDAFPLTPPMKAAKNEFSPKISLK